MADEQLDLRAAADLLAASTRAARRALEPRLWRLYAGWAAAWFLGFGAMWLSVHGQHPYRGPTTLPTLVLALLLILAAMVTVRVIGQATRGVTGRTRAQARLFGLAWFVGYAAVFAIQAALAHQGADARMLGVLGAAGPMLVTALVYLAGSAIWPDPSMCVIGSWVAGVAVVGAWTGPVGVLLAGSLLGGGGFAVMAGYVAWRSRS
jgi:hypothetical protein